MNEIFKLEISRLEVIKGKMGKNSWARKNKGVVSPQKKDSDGRYQNMSVNEMEASGVHFLFGH